MLEALFQAYADGPLGQFLKASTWAFALIEVLHLIALAALGGTVIVSAAAALGFGRKRRTVAATVAGLTPTFLVSLTVILTSGVLLVGTNAMKYYFNDAFRVKMILLGSAIVVFAWLSLRARRVGAAPIPVDLRIAGALSLALWLGVGLGGRLIGLL